MSDLPLGPENKPQRRMSNVNTASNAQRRRLPHNRPAPPRPDTTNSTDQEEGDIVPELTTSLKWREISEKRAQPSESHDYPNDDSSVHPPSFAQSEFETIIRRQKTNPNGLKITNVPSRFPHLDNDWEFAGWGSMRYLELSKSDMAEAQKVMEQQVYPQLDQFRASSIAANAVIGSVFYAFPAVAAASGIFSPISLLVACLLFFLYKPVLLELGSAVQLNGASYTYLLQFSSKTLGLIGAAATLLDAMATSTVAAATATAYLGGEFHTLPVPYSVLSIGLLVLITLMALVNSKDSTSITLAIAFFHMTTMAILMVFSGISWGRMGSATLLANWELRPTSAGSILRDIFNGICIGFLGVSGFECTPTYIEMFDIKKYPSVINTLIYSVILLNAPLMLLVYANLSSSEILSGSNVLSLLAELTAGRWLRTLLVVDAMLVLCGTIVTGIFTACGLLRTLAQDGILPPVFLREMPLTGQLFVPPVFFLLTCIALYATSAFQLSVISSVFSVTMLTVLLLYPVSNVLLKFNRDRLPRQYRASPLIVFLSFASIVVVLAGNLALSPIALGLFASYFVFLFLCLIFTKSQVKLARIAIWLYGQVDVFQRFKWTRGMDSAFVAIIRRTRRHAICVWMKGDDIYHLVDSILYVRRNEPTARVVFMHAYQNVEDIPSELAPNVKILDEAFPSITLDLMFVQGTFSPTLVQAVSKNLDIPRSKMFMSCFGSGHPYKLADYRGLRLIHH
ncbi:hypothetical protein M408DRAFT_269399 [Serendipita vermifera MAFF 305830]|uniref:Amino acid permease/ SLC12A domain-containing protein n=1 Tax=Serendipita vermifera MAFF 305830 TaxID=933852 RepID=A0A0C2W944_SERVB|nr:hypothetical protein M408DRAFT_269399 [Serendipita vermifera MAFF 305830]